MRVLAYVPKDRRMTRGEWREVDRWLRKTEKIVLSAVYERAEHLMIYGTVTVSPSERMKAGR